MKELRSVKEFDSEEEWLFFHWLKEAEEVGLISEIVYHPEPYLLMPNQKIAVLRQLKTKVVRKEVSLLQQVEFEIDFRFLVLPAWKKQRFFKCLVSRPKPEILKEISEELLYTGKTDIDTKGAASKFSDGRDFSLRQKLLWLTHRTYVNKVVASSQHFFKRTWIPEVAFGTIKRLGTKKEANIRSCPTRWDYLTKIGL